jgi:hypothetical protein
MALMWLDKCEMDLVEHLRRKRLAFLTQEGEADIYLVRYCLRGLELYRESIPAQQAVFLLRAGFDVKINERGIPFVCP